MASPVGACWSSPRRSIADASSCVWLSLHLLLYFMLDVATLTALSAPEVGGGLHFASKALYLFGLVLTSVLWPLPLQSAALLLAVGALAILRSGAGLPRPWFRIAAVSVFLILPLLLALLLSPGDSAPFLQVLPMHILMGLLVVQPRWPNMVPSRDRHRW
ncbi:hypothetical protein ACWT_4429 [Actinoplanes sp. SE50]|uniref:hypothetical protein n=2 Tax=Actinoplanes TaxID=1865 RepID=UPI00023ECCF0|nr:hypothetical protein [Actinoplanes sp. SE50/110]AEV85451.1 hypothetical protein ACPL_4560 [Actinoplanes sp. SE50/110]ATO83844.1 hypothetical protein ACWT_4429 [Actinoplanes sp. SE50]SLM01254.1 hypothetical protein ACSP50_4490 [Actinoplanes sp. SE50/110]